MYKLRDYQTDMVEALKAAFKDGHQGVFGVLPTGAGKTVIFCDLLAHYLRVKPGLKAIVVNHTVELVEQTSAKLSDFGIEHGIIQAQRNTNPKAAVQVCSIMTICDKPLPFEPDLIIIDEAHMAPAESYRKVIERYPEARRLLMSATPIRSDGQGFQDIAEELVLGPTVNDLIRADYLVLPMPVFPNTDLLKDMKQRDECLRKESSDFATDELVKRYNKPQFREVVVDTYLSCDAAHKKTLAFAINQDHARALCNDFKAAGVTAEMLTSQTPKRERERIMADFRAGRFEVLVVVEIAAEGLDVPDIEAVILARPTQSLALYLQQVGRGMRPAPGKKYLYVLDFGWNSWRFGSVRLERPWTLADTEPLDFRPQRKRKTIEVSPEECKRITEQHREIKQALIGQRRKDGKPVNHLKAYYDLKKLGGYSDNTLVAVLATSDIPPQIRRLFDV